ncbi:unnamed protein product, partial [marine sediment metagenome]
MLIEAASYSLPVIFDTRGRGSILNIAELIKSTRSELAQKYPDLLPHFKVIIAHFAQGNIGDHEVYNALVQPNTYGDLSMLHGEGAGNFFKDFRNWFKSQNKIRVDNRDWSEYLLYASDYPYFGDVHAQKLLKYIINKQFFDSGGTLNDVRNIMGLNQIKILPEYNLPQVRKDGPALPSTIITNALNENINSYDIAIKTLVKLITENKVDIKSFCIQFKETWKEFNEDVLLYTLKRATKEEIPMILTKLVKDRITL